MWKIALLCLLVPSVLHAEYKLESQKRLDSKVVTETSGVARSLEDSKSFYVHNDSGDKPRVFRIGLSGGKIKETIDFKGAKARDWEDITTGPCLHLDQASCIFVADFGDNSRKRKDYTIYSIGDKGSRKVGSFPFKYPRGKSYNAEGFAYDPDTAEFYIATKAHNRLYRLDVLDGEAHELCKFDFSAPITALDFDEDGKMLVRTKRDVYEFGSAKCDDLLSKSDYGYREKQGEAVSYLGHGREGFVSISEGRNPKVYVFRKK